MPAVPKSEPIPAAQSAAQKSGDLGASATPSQSAAVAKVEPTAEESKLIEAFRARDAAAMNRLASEYMKALDAFKDRGGADPSTMSDPAAIDERLALLERASKAHEQLTAAAGAVDERTRRELGAKQVRAEVIESIAIQRKNGMMPGVEIHRLETQILELTRERLALLKSNFGKWRAKADSNLELLDSFPKKEQERFVELTDWVQRLLADQQRMVEAERKESGRD